MKVLVSDKLEQSGVDILGKAPGISVDVKTGLAPEELVKIIGEYDGLVIRSATKVTSEILAAATRLKVVGRAGIGVDNVDLAEASRRGIVVMNTPGGNTVTTAEHAISMMCSLARLIPMADAALKAGKWEKKLMGVELMGKTLGVLGLGRIGSIVADRAQGLKMKVIAFDPYVTPEAGAKIGIEMVSMDDIFRRSDFITIHVPKTAETTNLINSANIAKMKKTVRIINCARGGIVNEKELAAALTEGRVGGAALDVFEKEPPEADNPLLKAPNAIFTPHLGASTGEAQENVAVAVAHQIVDFLTTGTIANAVNVPSVSADVLPQVRPFLALGDKLGSLATQLAGFAPKSLKVRYSGTVVDLPFKPITTAVLKGVMDPVMGTGVVNFVNAPIIAKERGMKVEEVKSTGVEDYSNLIEVTLSSGGESMSVAGFIFEGREPRLIAIDGFRMEAIPEGNVLVIRNLDRPGVIGNLGNTLGSHGINIASMQIGRDKPGGIALSFLQIDAEPDEKVLDALRKLPHMQSVKKVKFSA